MRRLLPKLVAALAVAVLFTSVAAASSPVVLMSKQITLKPSGTTIRLVASKTNLDKKRTGRVALWLTLYKKTGLGFKKVQQAKVTTGFKPSSGLKSLKVVQAKGAAVQEHGRGVPEVVRQPIGRPQTWSFVATLKHLAPQE